MCGYVVNNWDKVWDHSHKTTRLESMYKTKAVLISNKRPFATKSAIMQDFITLVDHRNRQIVDIKIFGYTYLLTCKQDLK